MSWIADAYSRGIGHFEPAVVTGKPLHLWGSKGREGATGSGLFFILEEAAKYLNFPILNKKVAILGFGNVGSSIAKLVYKAGCKIIAITDIFGGIFNENGIDPFKLHDHVKRTGSVCGFKDTTSINDEELIALRHSHADSCRGVNKFI